MYGEGFILTKEKSKSLININPSNSDILFPYLIGKDLNNNYRQEAERDVINFFDWDYEKAATYPECFNICLNEVKPQRDPIIAKGKQIHEYDFWKFWDKRLEKYETIANFERVLVLTKMSKTLAFVFVSPNQVFADTVVVIPFQSGDKFSILQSSIHNSWVWEYCTTMKSDPNYGTSNVLHNYPFPNNVSGEGAQTLNIIGEQYHEHRRKLMLIMKLGLTNTYNLYHSKDLSIGEIKKNCKQGDVISQQAYNDILKLRELHKQMDEAVLDAYGWGDIKLRHDFYEVDYLPENDRVRYTIHPDARKEVLKRLLELNHTIYEEEIKQGLHKEEDVAKFYEQKGIPVPAEVIAIMGVAKKEKTLRLAHGKNKTSKKSTANNGQDNLFSGADE